MSKPKFHVRRGDTVQVIAGNHKGATGKITSANRSFIRTARSLSARAPSMFPM